MIKHKQLSERIITNWAFFQCFFEVLILIVDMEIAEVEADEYEHEYPLGDLMIWFVFTKGPSRCPRNGQWKRSMELQCMGNSEEITFERIRDVDRVRNSHQYFPLGSSVWIM